MAEFCRIRISEVGNRVQVAWEFLPFAHCVGIASTRGALSSRMDGDLGQPDGAEKIADMLTTAAAEVSRQVRGAWSDLPLW